MKKPWRYPFTYVYHKWRSYDLWFLRYKAQQSYPLTLLPTRKIKILKKWKTLWYIIISHFCTTNDNYMMSGSWEMECDRQNSLSFWAIFCSFTLLKTRKSKFWKKMKRIPRDTIFLQKCTINHDHMLYCSWDTMHDRYNCY